MDEKYYANFVPPTDPNFKYDVRQSFDNVPKLDNSWDEDDYSDNFDWWLIIKYWLNEFKSKLNNSMRVYYEEVVFLIRTQSKVVQLRLNRLL